MFISAVFFPMTVVPEQYQGLLAMNPLVHAMELIREGWLPLYESPVARPGYLYMWTLCALALAISSYRLRWQRMIAR